MWSSETLIIKSFEIHYLKNATLRRCMLGNRLAQRLQPVSARLLILKTSMSPPPAHNHNFGSLRFANANSVPTVKFWGSLSLLIYWSLSPRWIKLVLVCKTLAAVNITLSTLSSADFCIPKLFKFSDQTDVYCSTIMESIHSHLILLRRHITDLCIWPP